MRLFQNCSICLILFLIGPSVAPPVTENKKDKNGHETEDKEQVLEVEYKRYLQEVVQLLENDQEFKQRLEKADPEHIKSGKISEDLEFVNHNVRTKLDELKRQELERLRHLAVKLYEESNGLDSKHLKIAAHVDHENPHTFESEDLKKLILQTTKDLDEADRERKKEFKEYEMEKELKYQEQLKHLDEQNKLAAMKEHEEKIKKHNEHPAIHHPGSKQQLEEVWEEQDHMDPENFNPKTFFHLHDLDGNAAWDANEVKALFRKELDKMYEANAPEDDIRERAEEMERMREHVFNETDTNQDRLISYQEFLAYTKKQEFEKDEGWEPIDQKDHPVYTEEEYKQYAAQHEAEIRRMIDQGLIPPAPPGYVPMVVPPGSEHHFPPGTQFHPIPPQHHIPSPPGAHPNAIPHSQQANLNPNLSPQQNYDNHIQQQQNYNPNQHQQQNYNPNQQYNQNQPNYNPNQQYNQNQPNYNPNQQYNQNQPNYNPNQNQQNFNQNQPNYNQNQNQQNFNPNQQINQNQPNYNQNNQNQPNNNQNNQNQQNYVAPPPVQNSQNPPAVNVPISSSQNPLPPPSNSHPVHNTNS